MSLLLESIVSSHSTLTSIASEKNVLHTLPSIDISTVGAIVSLFRPWKHVIERVQSTTTPSLHLVVTSYWYLLENLVVTKDEAADKTAKGESSLKKNRSVIWPLAGIVFFKRRARQLLKTMFNLHDLHWVAATLNPRTRMLKLATDAERNRAHELVRSEVVKIIDTQQVNDNQSVKVLTTAGSSPTPNKKFKSYTTQFDDDIDFSESNKSLTSSMRARRELETYLQLKLTKWTSSDNENENPLDFWKEQENVLPNLSKLAKKIFCVPASSAAVERAFSSAGVIITQRRSNISPAIVNDIILVRSAACHLQNYV